MSYHELSATERVTIQIGLCNGFSQRRLARLMNRSPSTVSREIRRNRNAQGEYVADDAQRLMHTRRVVCRPAKRLVPGNELFELVAHLLTLLGDDAAVVTDALARVSAAARSRH